MVTADNIRVGNEKSSLNISVSIMVFISIALTGINMKNNF